jgi:dipeptidyl aminopeptidase/acylaminoacyl peptidase
MPDGRTVIVSGNDSPDAERQYQRSNLYAIDVAYGTKRRLTAPDGQWTGPRASPDGKLIAFTGYPADRPVSYRAQDIYTIAPDGSGMTLRSPGLDRDPSGLTWAEDGTGLYFTAVDKGTSNLWFMALGSVPKPVTTGSHMLTGVDIAKNGVAFAVRSGTKQPPDIVRFELRKPAELTQLTDVNADILAGVKLGEVEELWYTSSGGAKVEGWVVKPPTFVPGRKYPLILEIHGGPHGNYNTAFNFQFQNFAANGYVVLYTNPRGSTSYGSLFGNAIFHAYPSVDYDDLMAGVDTVIGRGYVDTQHMYVGGCSGGGVLSSWVIGHTDRFAAAVSQYPVTDWVTQAGTADGGYSHSALWMKTLPWDNPQQFIEHSPIYYAKNFKTPTMVITGESDRRTPIAQSEELYFALKAQHVPAVLVRVPEEYHGIRVKNSHYIEKIEYILAWMEKYTKPL